jgi:hypothetical protein
MGRNGIAARAVQMVSDDDKMLVHACDGLDFASSKCMKGDGLAACALQLVRNDRSVCYGSID